MSRQKMDYENAIPVYRVIKGDEPPRAEEYRPGRWPRTLGTFAEQPDGSWRVRFRCPDGTIRRFRSRSRMGAAVSSARKAMRSDLRFAVLSRDGFRCRYCGRTASDVKLHVDHVIAVANGGPTSMDNLVAACADCNMGKAAS